MSKMKEYFFGDSFFPNYESLQSVPDSYLLRNDEPENCIPDMHIFNCDNDEDDFGVNADEDDDDDEQGNDNEILDSFRGSNKNFQKRFKDADEFVRLGFSVKAL
jgi:hypothetical protein